MKILPLSLVALVFPFKVWHCHMKSGANLFLFSLGVSGFLLSGEVTGKTLSIYNSCFSSAQEILFNAFLFSLFFLQRLLDEYVSFGVKTPCLLTFPSYFSFDLFFGSPFLGSPFLDPCKVVFLIWSPLGVNVSQCLWELLETVECVSELFNQGREEWSI